MPNRGLPKLAGGIAKAWREVWTKPCPLEGCGRPAAGAVDTAGGPKPICERHIPGAEARGFTVHRPAVVSQDVDPYPGHTARTPAWCGSPDRHQGHGRTGHRWCPGTDQGTGATATSPDADQA